MSEGEQFRDGAGKGVALVVAFLAAPLPFYPMVLAGYYVGSVNVMGWFVSFFVALLALFLAAINLVAGIIARGSVRKEMKRLATVALVLGLGGTLASCLGGTAWGAYELSQRNRGHR